MLKLIYFSGKEMELTGLVGPTGRKLRYAKEIAQKNKNIVQIADGDYILWERPANEVDELIDTALNQGKKKRTRKSKKK